MSDDYNNYLTTMYNDLYPSPDEIDEQKSNISSNIDTLAENKEIPQELPKETCPFRKSNIHQIFSEENATYFAHFEENQGQLHIYIKEKDSNPPNIYENFFTLDQLIFINSWFQIFDNMNDLLKEFELLIKNESFSLKLKNEGEISLYIVLPNTLIDPIEIIIPQDRIKERKLYREIYLHLLNVEQNHRQQTKKINDRLAALESLIGVSAAQSQDNRYSIKARENLEQMKNALKNEIKAMANEKIKLGAENFFKSNPENLNTAPLCIDTKQKPFQESSILTKNPNGDIENNELNLLLEWMAPAVNKLNNNPRVLHTKLIYNALTDGDKANNFHKKCDKLNKPTIVLIETKEGYRYGGYTSVNWDSPDKSEFKKDENAFIFSFNTKKKYETKNPEKSIQCSKYFGPYFGEGGTICVPDNFLDDVNTFYQWPSTYNLIQKDELTLGREHTIRIANYEVYTIDIE